jgi:hypothetical protein
MKRSFILPLLFTGVISIAGCGGASFLPNSQSSAQSSTQSSSISAVNVICNPTSISAGGAAQCQAAVSGSGAYSSDVMWSVDAGTISSSGLYTAPAVISGATSATVTAISKQDNNKSGRGVLSFGSSSNTAAISAVSVVASPSSIALGQTATCNATVSGTGNYSTAVNWTATGGTITQSGVFTPSGIGTGTCKATSTQDSTKSASASIVVSSTSAPISITGITVAANPSSISTSQTTTCVANVSGIGAFNNGVTWSATGGTITSGGVFTPSGAGTGTCKATSIQDSTKSASASIAVSSTSTPVTVTVTGITVTANPSSISSSQTTTCVASVSGTGAYSKNVTWSATGGTITSGGVFTPSVVGAGACIATSTQSGYTNVSGQAAINITGAGTSSSLNVSTTTIAFGTVNLNTPATQSVTLTATGTTAVTISGASVTGTGFSLSGATFPVTLNPNQTVQLFVAFDPTAAGSATGQLKITSNASSGATTLVNLTGTGQGVTYQVNLSWNAPASSADPVAGYNVFRAPTGSSAFQQVNTAEVTTTNYIDGSVQNGTTYDYVVRSVDASGGISDPSNTYTATIPN